MRSIVMGFLRFNPAFQKIYHASCTRIRAAARQQNSAPGLKSGSVGALYRDRCASAPLLKSCTGTQKWSLSKFVPRSRQSVSQIVPAFTRLALQAGSFAKIVHRTIFLSSALPCFAPFGLRNMSSQNDKSCRRHSGRLRTKNELLLPGR